jgi:hypothetical protein
MYYDWFVQLIEYLCMPTSVHFDLVLIFFVSTYLLCCFYYRLLPCYLFGVVYVMMLHCMVILVLGYLMLSGTVACYGLLEFDVLFVIISDLVLFIVVISLG